MIKVFIIIIALLCAVPVQADITTGLQLWWKFDENTGTTVADSSGNGITGTFGATPVWTAGQVNGALDFELGDSDYVDNAISVPITAVPASICAWIKPESLTTFGYIVSVFDSSGDSKISLRTDNASHAQAVITDSVSSSAIVTSTATLTNGIWTHLCATFTTGTNNLKIYVNGATPNTDTLDGITPSSLNTVAAGQNATVNFFDGIIDEVRIYSRVLSDADVIELRDYGNPSVQRLVTVSADDSQEVAGTNTITGTTIGASLDATTDWAAMRFLNIAIPNAATISSAILSVVPSATTEDEPLVTVFLEAADNCVTYTTGANNISGRSRTTGVAWSSADLAATGATYHDSPSLVTDVQAVVNRAGWASGNAMCVHIQGGSNATRDLTIEAYDLGPGTNPPRLTITYTVGAAAATVQFVPRFIQ